LERPQWGSYVAGSTLLVTPRPARRDTYVLHVPSGREWTLPTTGGGQFSDDGTVVAYAAATQNAPQAGGGGGGVNNVQPTTPVGPAPGGQGAGRYPPADQRLPRGLGARRGRHGQRPPPAQRAPQPPGQHRPLPAGHPRSVPRRPGARPPPDRRPDLTGRG